MTDLDFNGKRVLITGGAGFVGSNVTERVVRCGGRVTVLDDLCTGSRDNINPGTDYQFVEGSVTDESLVFRLVKEADLVIHMAARNIIVSTKNPREDYAVNIGGTLNVLLAAREHGVERMVYTSSASIYGNPRIIPISEDERPLTFSPYAVSKLAGENYCYAFYETYGVPVAVVRYSNVYGPKQSPNNPYCGVVAKFMDAVARGETPQVHGDGQQTRDFTFVDDAVDGTLLTLLSPKAEGMAFNLGTGTETRIIELIGILGRLYGREIAPRHIDRRDIDNIRRRVLNIERIRTTLRWQPQIGLEEGLRRTLEWFRNRK
ncbi:MAG: NAD-dependent epimerase/dehydratase family protein [candidate division Zixibacteria bacterium]|nr:NAD-dependent epimerase/dehydratase family protein [candidate division Zixibacteria bacterium]